MFSCNTKEINTKNAQNVWLPYMFGRKIRNIFGFDQKGNIMEYFD